MRCTIREVDEVDIDEVEGFTGLTVIFKGMGLVAEHTRDGDDCAPPLFLTKEDIDCRTGETLYDHLYRSILEGYRREGVPQHSLGFECLIKSAGLPVQQTTALSYAILAINPRLTHNVYVHDADHPDDHSYDMSHQQRSRMHQVVVEVLGNIDSPQIPDDLIDLCLEFLGVTSRGFLRQLYQLFLKQHPTLYAGRTSTSPSSTSSASSKKKRKTPAKEVDKVKKKRHPRHQVPRRQIQFGTFAAKFGTFATPAANGDDGDDGDDGDEVDPKDDEDDGDDAEEDDTARAHVNERKTLQTLLWEWSGRGCPLDEL
jgi:hypothetical protein